MFVRAGWILVLALALAVPTIPATPPSAPLDMALRVEGTPTLHETFLVTVTVTAYIAIGNVTVDVFIPPGWEKDPVGNRTFNLREQDERALVWHVTPTSEGFWTVGAHLEAYQGGMTSWTQYWGFLHGNESRVAGGHTSVIPTPIVDLQFRAVEQTPANVTLIATATPQASWMRFGTLTTEFGILNETKNAEGPGNRALVATLTTPIPPHYGARAWAQFGFTPDWRTETPKNSGDSARYGTSLGCRDLWVNREAGPTLDMEPSRDCEQVRSHLAPGPGIAALAILGVAAAWIRRRPT